MTPIWGTVTCPLGQVTSRRGEGMHLFRTLPCLSTGNFPCLGGYLLPAFCPPPPPTLGAPVPRPLPTLRFSPSFTVTPSTC